MAVHCDTCGEDRIVPFSCKGRGFCNSCGGRRMADTAAHLVDRVFPEVPVRQWVLSLPFSLRYRLAYDACLVSEVLRIFVQAVFRSLGGRAREHAGIPRSQCGARSEEHTSELQSHSDLVCRLLLEKKNDNFHPSGGSNMPRGPPAPRLLSGR